MLNTKITDLQLLGEDCKGCDAMVTEQESDQQMQIEMQQLLQEAEQAAEEQKEKEVETL